MPATGNPTWADGAVGGTPITAATLNAMESAHTAAAPSASPAFTGTPTAPTASAGTSTTQIATTAFVTTAPQFSGSPTAATPSGGDNSTKLATTAFVVAGFRTNFHGVSQLSGTQTLTAAGTDPVFVNTGAAATWTLPAVSGNTGAEINIKNRGSGALTVQRAGSDQIYAPNGIGLVTSVSVAASGGSIRLICDGTYWCSI